MQLVQQFKADNTVAVANEKMGMNGVRLMTRAEYRKEHQLGRSDSERLHNQYLRENGVRANQQVSAQIAGGQLLIVGIKEYQSGKGQISFVRADKVVDKADAKPDVAKLTEAELVAALEAVRAAKKN